MRSSKWLRFGLTSLIVGSAALGAVLVACSDDDPATGGPTTPDSGGDTETPPPPPPDSGPDAAKPSPAKLQVVNAATDLGPNDPSGFLRICYGIDTGTVIYPLPALPDTKSSDSFPFPGIPIGTGGVAQTIGASLETLTIVPYVMNAQALATRGIVKGDAGNAGMGCGDLLGPDKDAGGQGPLVENVDYWKLPNLTAGMFKNEKSYVLVLTGCVADSEMDADKCGADFTATGNPGLGNLKLTAYELDRSTTIDSAKIGTQFLHASAAGATALGEAGGVMPGYTGPDGGGFKAVSEDGGAVSVNTITPLKQVEGVNVATDNFTANPLVPTLNIPLPLIQMLSFGPTPPAGANYRNGAAFTFIAIGDPEEDADAGGNFNTKKFHYIALPNDPTPVIYK